MDNQDNLQTQETHQMVSETKLLEGVLKTVSRLSQVEDALTVSTLAEEDPEMTAKLANALVGISRLRVSAQIDMIRIQREGNTTVDESQTNAIARFPTLMPMPGDD